MAASILVLVFLVLTLVAVVVLAVRLCQRRVDNRKRIGRTEGNGKAQESGSKGSTPQITSLNGKVIS